MATFRAKTHSLTANPGEPAGTAAGDDVFLWVISNTGTPAAPVGWTVLGTWIGTNSRFALWWIKRGSSAPSYTWTGGTGFIESSAEAWQGRVSSSTPVAVVKAAHQINPQNPLCPATASSPADTTVILFGGSWTGSVGSVWAPPATYTIREDGGATVGNDLMSADKLLAVAGVETPAAFSNGSATLDDVAEATVTLLPDSVGGVALLAVLPSIPGSPRYAKWMARAQPNLPSASVPVIVSATLATHSYAAQTPQVRARVQPAQVTHSYTAIAPKFIGSVRPAQATHTYLGQVPQVRARVQPGQVMHSYTAVAPKFIGSIKNAPVAHSYTAIAPKFIGSVKPAQATHTYVGQAPQVRARVQPAQVTHSYTARVPQVRARVQPAAATHSYLGRVPGILTGGALAPPAASHSYTARAPQVRASVKTAQATHSYLGRVPAAIVGSKISPAQVTHSYTARAPKLQARVQPGAVTHTYTARAPAFSNGGVIPVYGWGARGKLGTASATDPWQRVGSQTAAATVQSVGSETAAAAADGIGSESAADPFDSIGSTTAIPKTGKIGSE